jgi:hypothetical protein
MAIADPLSDHDFFRRYASNVAFMDLGVSAIAFNIDLGLYRRSTPADLLKNIPSIGFLQIPGIRRLQP